jgi:hypothetical protein
MDPMWRIPTFNFAWAELSWAELKNPIRARDRVIRKNFLMMGDFFAFIWFSPSFASAFLDLINRIM